MKKEIFEHLNRQIPPEAHTAMYNFHKYWSRKTWNVVGKFIENYTKEGDIVFDPFGGSGVTALEALKRGRKVITCDINPMACEITRLTIKKVALARLMEEFNKIQDKIQHKIENLYQTKCPKCKHIFPFTCAIWQNNQCVSIRYKACPNCGSSAEFGIDLTKFDKNILNNINHSEIKEWYPKDKMYYSNNAPFMKKEKFETIDELFTKRNLCALAILMDEIEKIDNKDIKAFFKIAFSSILHLCTSMTPVRPTRPLSSAWTEHSYWYANEFMEQNVWDKFDSAINGRQGLLKAKQESNLYYLNKKFGKTFADVVNGSADIFIYNGSCLDLMDKMSKFYGNEEFIDYIFTDPPYDSSIQYGELSLLWVSWLKLDENYLEHIELDEIIHNERQNKSFDVYHALLRNSFEGMYRILKPGKFLTLTFHNPTFKVRNATIRAGVLTGFNLQKIHHQELARPSAKSLLQPFGSAQGDFYLRFHKDKESKSGGILIDDLRFDKIVLDTTIKILAERSEPTPYTIIINAIDPELAKYGFFSELNTGLDVKTVLNNHLNKEFVLVDAKIGGSKGQLWWFKNPNLVPHLQSVPLSERVDRTVLAKLQQKGKVTFTDIWEAISIEFPNSLTSDQSSIRQSLETYATPKTGFWLLKSNFKIAKVEKEHSTIIAILAKIGRNKGYDIFIGKHEQNHELISDFLKEKGKLNQFMSYSNINKLRNIKNPDIVDDIDILWIKNNEIEYMFEVECTTSMTSALQRGSNLSPEVKKIMLFPIDREKQFQQKMKSPMFIQRFEEDNWSTIIFDNLYNAWSVDKSNTEIANLLDKETSQKRIKKNDDNEQLIFTDNWD